MKDLLESIPVSVFDCQTTGASPGKGHLLELAWAPVPGDPENEVRVHSFLVALPEGETVPGRISGLTGITDEMLAGAIGPCELARLVRPVLEGTVPVAHFASFEQRWLDHLMSLLPGEIHAPAMICTREIARRLLPGIPRKGLRALSGYLGHSLGECRRASDHVLATVHIWRRLLEMLRSGGVLSMEELREFLQGPVPVHEEGFEYPLPRERRLSLPDSPGVYRFLSASGKLLYVGKATSLRSRVNSYFTRRKGSERTLELVTQVHDVQVQECCSPLEAAMMEFELIDSCDPPYNVALRDRGTCVHYLSPDLSESTPRSDADHPWGPVPDGSSALLLDRIRAALLKDVPPPPETIGLDYLPLEDGALEEGFEAFRSALAEDGGFSFRGMYRAGAGLWAAMKEAAQEGPGAEDGEEQGPPPETIGPDGVGRHLEWLLASGVRDLLRGAWFLLLGWSGLTWQPRTSGSPRTVWFSCGRVMEPSRDTDLPSRLQRMLQIDGSAYRRLRVLDGEVRRISADGSLSGLYIPGGRELGAGEMLSLYGHL